MISLAALIVFPVTAIGHQGKARDHLTVKTSLIAPSARLELVRRSTSSDPGSEMLVLRKGNLDYVFKSSLLEGHARITNEVEALEYVRLFSNPRTASSVGMWLGIEIRPGEEVDATWFCGDAKLFALAKGVQGTLGLCRRTELRRQKGWQNPSVKVADGGYLITRVIMRMTDSPLHCFPYLTSELISRDGRVTRRRELKLQWKLKSAILNIPPEW